MMAYMVLRTIVFCLVGGKFGFFMNFIFFSIILPQKEELDFCYHDLLFCVNAIA